MPPTAIILAAGRGERLRPLTDHTPKPLLRVRGKRLIEWHLEALARAGVQQVVINTCWLEDQFPAALGDGARWGLSIHYSREGHEPGGALETAGGVARALPWLGDHFWVVSGDVFVPRFDFAGSAAEAFAASPWLAQLWLAPNAPHHPGGDFSIGPEGRALISGQPRRTWASVGLFKAALFRPLEPGTRLPLRPLLLDAAARGLLGALAWDGGWTDIGTTERLAEADRC